MKKLNVMIAVLMSLVFATSSVAGTSEVKWSNPDDYRDVDAGEGHRVKFKERVFADFDKHFAKLAQKLPEGQILMIDVTDVDLAGDVNQSMQRVRIVKDIFFPRIEFSYQLQDANKQVITKGEVNLKDMSFLMGSQLRYKNESLGYEKKMLDDWFGKTFM